MNSPNRIEMVKLAFIGSNSTACYREYVNDLLRPAYIQDLKYDATKGSIVGFKGARVEILSADNTSITYRVITPIQQ